MAVNHRVRGSSPCWGAKHKSPAGYPGGAFCIPLGGHTPKRNHRTMRLLSNCRTLVKGSRNATIRITGFSPLHLTLYASTLLVCYDHHPHHLFLLFLTVPPWSVDVRHFSRRTMTDPSLCTGWCKLSLAGLSISDDHPLLTILPFFACLSFGPAPG